ncbi:5'-nucleotidase domaiN-containing protein [Nitritalea halalkaliphila LW7]|uniref:5'-nucleotidase domaiN-containing protein n=1 Tax=Nitritalea halalkaliphila LW7 TaxID=1189621 RepID=I5C4C9_9BACT|nr:5'-nucleotidase [Nitritalea halalkaliphila]EIM76681.1 5'-nucleotidase domaiN-containing protein [Nitritalea halalkaliphila LW7]
MAQSAKFLYTRLPFLALLFLLSCASPLVKSPDFEFIELSENMAILADTEAFVLPYRLQMEREMGRVLGESPEEIVRGRGENALGNLVTDLQASYTAEKMGLPVDISLMNNGGMRSNLPAGPITLGHIFELSPFDNYLVILEGNKAAVEALAAFAAERQNISVSGMEIRSEGGRVREITVGGKALEAGRMYRIAANDYIANGGDYMEFLVPLKRVEETSLTLRELLIERIEARTAQGEAITAAIENRQVHR